MAGILFLFALIILVHLFSYFLYKTYFYSPSVSFDQLKGKRVIITGASRGIGEQFAYEYARYKCRLVLAARSIDVLKNQVAEQCRQLGATQVECIEFDASKEEACINLVKKTVEFYGGIDILVLNHTMALYEPLFTNNIDTIIQQTKDLFQTNFFGYFHTAMAALPHLTKSGTLEQPSQIIAISSMTGCCPFPKTSLYGTTKHAIQGFFLNLAHELRTSETYQGRVTVTVASLGFIATDQAMRSVKKSLHIVAIDPRETAQAVLVAGLRGQTHVFHPQTLIFVPVLYYVCKPLFELLARLCS